MNILTNGIANATIKATTDFAFATNFTSVIGYETATSFTLNFDAAKLVNPSILLGKDITGAALTVNTSEANNGHVMVLIGLALYARKSALGMSLTGPT